MIICYRWELFPQLRLDPSGVLGLAGVLHHVDRATRVFAQWKQARALNFGWSKCGKIRRLLPKEEIAGSSPASRTLGRRIL